MYTLELPDKTLYQYPDHLDDMALGQRSWAIQQAILYSAGQIDYTTFVVRVFCKISNIKRTWQSIAKEAFFGKVYKETKLINLLVIAEDYCSQLFELDNQSKKFQREALYNSMLAPFPSVWIGFWKRVRLRLPKDYLQNMSFGEFRAAISELNMYFESRSSEDLHRFLACIIRPEVANAKELIKSPGYKGDLREPFNEERIELNARHTAKLQHWQKSAALLWFTWCINYIQGNEISLNDRTINLSELFPKPLEGEEPVKDPSAAGWKSILNSVAKAGIYGTADQVDSKNLYTVLEFIFDQHHENKRLERKFKKK